jgi:hypothetical protein
VLICDNDQTWKPSGRSQVVHELFKLTPIQKTRLGVTNAQLRIAEAVFNICSTLINDADPRQLVDRLEDLGDLLPDFQFDEEAHAAWVAAGSPIPKWLRLKTSASYKAWLRRFLGAARFERLSDALRNDSSVLFIMTRRAIRHSLPLAAAVDSCNRSLTQSQRAKIPGLSELSADSVMETVVRLDSAMDRLLADAALIDLTSARAEEREALPPSVGNMVLEQMTTDSSKLIQDLSAMLARKVQGARDALRFSADPVSQAANSLIELIDRMLREAYTHEEVLAWIAEACPERSHKLCHTEAGTLRPTKLAEALCFVHAGEVPQTVNMFHELSAVSFVVIRKELQQLKHQDAGTQREKQQLTLRLSQLEATLILCFKLCWLTADENHLGTLKQRLAEAA